jgi:hypothetical protein
VTEFPPLHFHIPGRLSPVRSPLGHLVWRLSDDRLRAEARYYLLAVAAVAGYLALSAVSWAVVNLGEPPSTQQATAFWIWQIGMGLVVAGLSWIGYQPALHVSLDSRGLCVRQRRAVLLQVEPGDLGAATRISGDTLQQHYRLYRQSRVFVGAALRRFILVRTTMGPIVLGIDPAEQSEFLDALAAMGVETSQAARVA